MTKRPPKFYDPSNLIDAIKKWPMPLEDKKHGYFIYLEERARSNESRIDHIIEYGHDLKVRDIKLVPQGIKKYFAYKKDKVYKNTYNYYIKRGGHDKGLIKVSIQIDPRNSNYAWIKTIFITYVIK